MTVDQLASEIKGVASAMRTASKLPLLPATYAAEMAVVADQLDKYAADPAFLATVLKDVDNGVAVIVWIVQHLKGAGKHFAAKWLETF